MTNYSFGIGDRFCMQARAQLQALISLRELGVDVIPVWNKSNREHLIVGSEPESTRKAADSAVRELGWDLPYHCDADHIRCDTVGRFLPYCDFFTIDVADWIGAEADKSEIDSFIESHPELLKPLEVYGIDSHIRLSRESLGGSVARYRTATKEAGRIYRHIREQRGGNGFITEVSMDETAEAQSPADLLLILLCLAEEGVPVETIAPKFTGRFNKGVDFEGDVKRFEKEFNEDLAIIRHACQAYGLPSTLKLSVHSGSDKFSLYGPIRRALAKSGGGIHVKTAGTTWLEEVSGLAESGGEGLRLAKDIYGKAFMKREELCEPYASVIDIDPTKLPFPEEVSGWSSSQFVDALAHDETCPAYNPSLRQLLHVGYKVAAQMGERFLDAVRACEATIGPRVTENLLERHLKPLFLE